MSSTLYTAVGISLAYASLRMWLAWTQDPQEPPALENSVPFIGPVLQIFNHKGDFYLYMKKKYGLALYTLRIFGERVYVVNDTRLITIAQKHSSALSFNPMMAKAVHQMGGTRDDTYEIMLRDATAPHGFLETYNTTIHKILTSGPTAETIARDASRIVLKSMDSQIEAGSRQVSMFSWVRSELMLAVTDAVYGPGNPFRKPGVEKAWYEFEPGAATLALKIVPSFLHGATFKAREALAAAFDDFFASGAHKESSDLIQAIHECITEKHQVREVSQRARLEVAGAFAVIANTVVTAFWVLYHIVSDPVLLESCRRELASHVREQDGTCMFDFNAVKDSCPVLESVLYEVLRFHGVQTSLRRVLEDYTLGDRILKKGGALMIPAVVPHFDQAIWGPDVGTFDNTRFLEPASKGGGIKKSKTRVGFRGFGSGQHLCPGRQLASMEIFGFVAPAILRFDYAPMQGEWKAIPSIKLSSMGTAVTMPDIDPRINISPRGSTQSMPMARVWKISEDHV